MMRVSEYNKLLKNDLEFQSAVNELSQKLGYKPSTDILHKEFEISGVLDLTKNQLLIASLPEDIIYPLDDLDHAYVDFIKESIVSHNRKQIPLSTKALNLLDEKFKDRDKKPDITHLDAFEIDNDTSQSQRVLEQAFVNEMLFLNELEEYLSEQGIDPSKANKDSLTKLVSNKAFLQVNKDDIKDLHKEIDNVLQL